MLEQTASSIRDSERPVRYKTIPNFQIVLVYCGCQVDTVNWVNINLISCFVSCLKVFNPSVLSRKWNLLAKFGLFESIGFEGPINEEVLKFET